MRLHSATERKDGPKSVRQPADALPRWVKLSCVAGLIMVGTVVGWHLAGGGMGHMAHGEADTHAAHAEQDRHRR
jgi:hypothetical protein